jgi:hypothetical protein
MNTAGYRLDCPVNPADKEKYRALITVVQMIHSVAYKGREILKTKEDVIR